MDKYQPIQCGLHDIIEDRIVRRRPCTLVYRCPDESTTRRYSGRLADVLARDGAEFVALQDGTLVRLDRVLQLDEVNFA